MAKIALALSTASFILVVVLFLLFLDHRQTLRLRDEGGDPRITMGTMADGNPFVTILSRDGRELGSLQVSDGRELRLSFKGPLGKSGIEFICTAEGPILRTTYMGTTLWTSDE